MLPGPRSAPQLVDSAADPFGWRVANALAIAAPYLLAGALFTVLYLEPAGPPARAALSTSPTAPASDVTVAEPPAAVPARAPGRALPAASGAAAPAPVKTDELPASRAAVIAPGARPAAGAPAPVVPAAAKEPAVPSQPVPVEAAIAGTMRLPGDTTAYPAAARSAQIQGVVVLAAAIGADGAVQSVEPVSGPALLEVAALNAVRAWRYRPWLVEGNAVPFTTQVIIHFEIDAPPQ